jgi:uncharacterized metal-binding protein YceD (DUF177 family)
MSIPNHDRLPLSRPIRTESITLRPVPVELVAPPESLSAIADFLGVASLEALKANYALSRNGERVKLEGSIKAQLHQTCVVTLEAFPVALAVPVKLDFAPQEEIAEQPQTPADAEIDIEVMLNEEDPPEPIIGGSIDLGAVTLEFLALSLDPYPRKPGAQFLEPAPEEAAQSPFAALARLKRGE